MKSKVGRKRRSVNPHQVKRTLAVSAARVAEAVWTACPDEDKLIACLMSDTFRQRCPRLARWSDHGVAGHAALRNITGLLLGEGIESGLSALVASRLVATESLEETKILREALIAEARALGKEPVLVKEWKRARLTSTKDKALSLGSRKGARALFGATPRRQVPLFIVQALRGVASDDVLTRDSAGRGTARTEPQHFLEKSWNSTYFEDIVPAMPKVYQRVLKDNPDFELPQLKKDVEETKWRRGMRIVMNNRGETSGLKSVACQDHVEGLGRKTIIAFSSKMTREMVKRCSKTFAWAGRGLLICGTKMGSFCTMCRVTGPKWKRVVGALEAKARRSPKEEDDLRKARRHVAKYEYHLMMAKVAYFWLTKVRLLMVRDLNFAKAAIAVMDYGTVKDSQFADIKFLAIHMVEKDVGAADGLKRWAEVVLFRKPKPQGGNDDDSEEEDPQGTGACGECCIRLFEKCLSSLDIFRWYTRLFLQSDNGNGFHGISFLGYLSGVETEFKLHVQYHYRPGGHASGPQDGVVNRIQKALDKAVRRGDVQGLEAAARFIRDREHRRKRRKGRKTGPLNVHLVGNVMDLPRGHADKHPTVSSAPGITMVNMVTFPSPGIAVGRPTMGETEKTSVFRLWSDLNWCSFCTRLHPERKFVAAHKHENCPSRGKKAALAQSPFLKAFAAVKEHHQGGGLAGLRARDPDLDLGKECMRSAGIVVSDSESEDGLGLDTESESDSEADSTDEAGVASSSSSAMVVSGASAHLVNDAEDVDQNPRMEVQHARRGTERRYGGAGEHGGRGGVQGDEGQDEE